jgi:hypothetical protein
VPSLLLAHSFSVDAKNKLFFPDFIGPVFFSHEKNWLFLFLFWNFNRHSIFFFAPRHQGCQIILGTTYQNSEKFIRWPQNVPNGHKIAQISVKYYKYVNIFQCTRALQNLPKWWFFGLKKNIWQPCVGTTCRRGPLVLGNPLQQVANMFGQSDLRQGCQIFLGSNILHWEKYNKWPQTIPNGHKLYQMTIKYSNWS